MEMNKPFNPVFARPPQTRFDRPSARTTFQFKGVVTPKSGDDKDTFVSAVNLALKWVKSRFPEKFPDEAWAAESFSVSLHDERVECIAIPDDNIWSLRLTHPDKPFHDQSAVTGRTWVNDIVMRELGNRKVMVGIRGQCVSRSYATKGIALTRPKIVLNLANEFNLSETRLVDPTPWILESEDDLTELEKLLFDPERTMPVYVLTQPDQSRSEQRLAPFMLDHSQLARKTQGMAYVVALPWELGFKWTERVGKTWSAFLGAVRTYMPGLAFEKDIPSSHPLALADRIQWFKYGDSAKVGEGAFLDFLVEKAHEHSASKSIDWRECLFLTDARARKAELDREKAKGIENQRSALEEQIEAQKNQIDELFSESVAYLDESKVAEQGRLYYESENQKLRAQIQALRSQLEAKTGASATIPVELPTSYDDIPAWVDKNHAGRLELLPRAIRSLKDAEFENVSHLCEALQLLAIEYHDMKLGYPDRKQKFDKKLTSLSLRCSPSIREENAGQFQDDYYVVYPPHENRKRFLALHLRSKGNTRQPKRCLAVYFFWDDATQQVIVGYLPAHLRIATSN